MSHPTHSTIGAPERPYGVMAQFETEAGLIHALEKVREAGYSKLDAYTPYPSHDVIHALGAPRSKVPLIVLLGGITGALLGYGLQYWTAAIDYPMNIGGRPLNSWVSFIVVTFELTILMAALSGVIGMFALNGLPQPYHPVFNVQSFVERGSEDRFFLLVESTDTRFDETGTGRMLQDLGALTVERVDP